MMDYIKNAMCPGKWVGVLALLFLFSCSDSTSRDTTQRRPDIQITDSPVRVQDNPFAPVDVSPMDIAYLPSDYPIMKMTGGAKPLPLARVIYSRPHRQGRAIFGGLIKYGEPWRLGANEATEIEFFQPVTIQNKKIPKGRYVLYCIPQEDKWTINGVESVCLLPVRSKYFLLILLVIFIMSRATSLCLFSSEAKSGCSSPSRFTWQKLHFTFSEPVKWCITLSICFSVISLGSTFKFL